MDPRPHSLPCTGTIHCDQHWTRKRSICFTRTMNTYKVCVTVNLYTHLSTRVYKRSSFPCLRQVPKFHELCDLPIVDKSYKLGTLRQCSDSVDEMFRVIMANRLSQRQSPKFDEG